MFNVALSPIFTNSVDLSDNAVSISISSPPVPVEVSTENQNE